MNDYDVYVVDDEDVAREGIALALRNDYRVAAFPSAELALEAMEKGLPDLVLLDIGLPGMDGIEALGAIKKRSPETVVIMITAYEDVKTVVSAMKLGAYDYVVKPLQMDGLLLSVRNALESVRMRKEIQSLHERYLKENVPCFLGESDAVQDIMEIVGKVAASPDTAVMILGETGTGKELIARAIHYRSPHFKGPMVSVNCAAIPRELIESELFGYEKGAFSGAEASGKSGLVEEAADGTLFLDEVGDLSMDAQAKLLRFLEEGEYYRVGGTRSRKVRTRIISATNRDLEAMMSEGRFRKDLYYRLAVVRIEIPSLNQRRKDIMPIATHFLAQFNEKFGKSFLGFSEEAREALEGFHWTGNVRELKNLVERGVLLGEGPLLTPEGLGLERVTSAGGDAGPGQRWNLPPLSAEGFDLLGLLGEIERRYLREALRLSGDNESRAARLLGISRDTFRYRKKRL